MAGGEGTRLRPLTCDCPKPMIRLMNRPVMLYALALLRRYGVTQVAATLGYQPDAIMDAFEDGDACGVDLRYYVEKTPLGTAGGVKQASDFLDETFLVLSGDGITDLDIAAATAFHREKGALATLVLKRADNPLDYGVVLTGADGRVKSFHEKPDWSEVVSDTVNTGIYILEPQVLERIPEGRPCDFGHDLFPALVKAGLPVFGYVMDGYWCDIGDVRAYLAAHADAMEGRIHVEGLEPGPGRVAQMPGARVDRAAVLEGPCLIGPNARVLAGAYVGPYSVIGPDCVVGESASVKRAVLWQGARLERGAQARGCVLGAGAVLGEGAQAYEESVLGTGAMLGERAVLLPGVKLWPGKRGADGERLEANLVWGSRREAGFDGGVWALDCPARAARAAQAMVSALGCGELLLGRAPDGEANALWHAAAAGALAQGAAVLDAGACALPQLRRAQATLGRPHAALVTARGLLPLNPSGADLTSRQRRAILARHARQDFDAPFAGATPAITSAGPVDAAYVAWSASLFAADPDDAPPVALWAGDDALTDVAERAFCRAGLRTCRAEAGDAALAPGEVGISLFASGEQCAFRDEAGSLSEAETQLLAAWTALELGEDALLMPAEATRAARDLAQARGARVEFMGGEDALWLNALAQRCPRQFTLQRDGIAGALMTLSALASAKLTLSDWRRGMPRVSRRSRSVPVPLSRAGRVLRVMAQREADVEPGGGMRLRRDDGWAWIRPDARRAAFRVVAEAASDETARELCDFCERELKRIAGGKE